MKLFSRHRIHIKPGSDFNSVILGEVKASFKQFIVMHSVTYNIILLVCLSTHDAVNRQEQKLT